MNSRALRLAVAAVSVLVVLSACSQEGKSPAVTSPTPSVGFDGAMTAYNSLLGEVRTVVSETTGDADWTVVTPAETGPCGTDDQGNANAMRGFTETWSSGAVPDGQWDQVLAAVGAASAAQGFSAVEVMADSPGNHSARITGPGGAVLKIASQDTTKVEIDSGCIPLG